MIPSKISQSIEIPNSLNKNVFKIGTSRIIQNWWLTELGQLWKTQFFSRVLTLWLYRH
jgi:hypothetical protein